MTEKEVMKKVRYQLASLPEVLHATEQEIADTMGVTLRTYRKYCCEPVNLKVEYIRNLVNVYPITVDYLLGITDFPYIMTEEIKKIIEKVASHSEEES